VIERGSASGGAHDTRSVGLEGRAVSLDQDGDGLLVEDGLDSADGVGGDHLVALGLDAKSSAVVSAVSISAGVRV